MAGQAGFRLVGAGAHWVSESAGSPSSGQLSLLVSMKSQRPSLFRSTRTCVLSCVAERKMGSRSKELHPTPVPLAPASQGPTTAVAVVALVAGVEPAVYVKVLAVTAVIAKFPLYAATLAP